MIESKVIDALRERYPDIHPLLFQRSIEYSETAGELFDVLESVPSLPVLWDGKKRCWTTIKDVTLTKQRKAVTSQEGSEND